MVDLRGAGAAFERVRTKAAALARTMHRVYVEMPAAKAELRAEGLAARAAFES